MTTVSALGLPGDDAIVLHDSNRLVLRLLPCDIVARVAHVPHRAGAAFEVELARRLGQTVSPIATLDARVEPQIYVRGGFVVTLWTYYEGLAPGVVAPATYARRLQLLHAGMRQIDIAAPHFTDRVAEAQSLIGSPDDTPELPDADRQLLGITLGSVTQGIVERTTAEQLLHGEPHPGNLLRTENGLLFIDLETACRGPVEFDVAHAPREVGKQYLDVDPTLVDQCRLLVLAMVIAWRWDRRDELPNGRELALMWMGELRAALG
jgi:Ser/Thr protein kinase RdoA (MazF antagonist)